MVFSGPVDSGINRAGAHGCDAMSGEAIMYTVFVRDEQGNMKVVHDWRSGDEPALMGEADMVELVGRIRAAYPHATQGLEFCFWYSGDSWGRAGGTRITPAYDKLMTFRAFIFGAPTIPPDLPEPRVPLERTVLAAITSDEREAAGGWQGVDRELHDVPIKIDA